MIDCRVMAGPERYDAFSLMKRFRSDEALLGDALALFVDREDFGFIWLAYEDDSPVGCASVGYVITTDAGGVVAVVRDVYVLAEARRHGVATAMLAALSARLDALDVRRIDVPVAGDPGLQAFLLAAGYRATDERTFSLDR
jgi:GNAT superfamily N-acetyltransferase